MALVNLFVRIKPSTDQAMRAAVKRSHYRSIAEFVNAALAKAIDDDRRDGKIDQLTRASSAIK